MPARTLRTAATLLVVAVTVAGVAQTVSTAQAQAAARSGVTAKPNVKRFKQRVTLLRAKHGGLTGPTTGAPQTSTTASRINSGSTGNPDRDAYCQQVADLINDAILQSDLAALAGDKQGSQEWWDLAMYMLGGGQANGCHFSQSLRLKTTLVRGAVLTAR